MHILVTNDDGVNAPGLLALAQAMLALAETLIPKGKVTVLAPDRNWCALGHLKTLDHPLRLKEAILMDGMKIYRDELVRRKDPRGRPYYWIGGEAPSGKIEDGTDIGALHDGYVSVIPVKLDLTAYNLIPMVQEWSWE